MTIRTRQGTSGFTLVEIMIVVAIIGLLAAIAIPNFVKARQTAQRNACISNLRMIDGAKESWALENRAASGGAVTEEGPTGVNSYIKGNARPVCPGGGTYTYGNVDDKPTCSVAGHTI
jgi:prepilin-type N-terminal cleavage/methylation domain-containing protein